MPTRPRTIGNPMTWAVGAAIGTGEALGQAADALGPRDQATPRVNDIGIDDLRQALRKGVDDFAAMRSDVMVLVAIYPLIGLALATLALDHTLLPLFFPLVSGFALLGPIAAVGLYEMSRRRELGQDVGWGAALASLRARNLGPMLALGAGLLAIFLAWIVAAHTIFAATVGPEAPVSAAAFLTETFTTPAGWAMIVVGTLVGFLFAALVLVISLVSFPMLLDRRVGLPLAVVTSVRVARRNPATVAAWGLTVAVALALGSLPFFIGLVLVLPVLGHATWHLYRAAVSYDPAA